MAEVIATLVSLKTCRHQLLQKCFGGQSMNVILHSPKVTYNAHVVKYV